MTRYNVEAQWDDPFEPRDERRGNERLSIKLKVLISVSAEDSRHTLRGPGIVADLSQNGMFVITKHVLKPLQRIMLEIPTHMSLASGCLPEAFVGTATVVRVQQLNEKRYAVALQFGEVFSQNMEFALFVKSLQTTPRDHLVSA
jgi:hypothetical protein